jgi:hypothetical protein
MREARIEKRLAGTDGAAIARTLSECLADLAREIAASVREISPR